MKFLILGLIIISILILQIYFVQKEKESFCIRSRTSIRE